MQPPPPESVSNIYFECSVHQFYFLFIYLFLKKSIWCRQLGQAIAGALDSAAEVAALQVLSFHRDEAGGLF